MASHVARRGLRSVANHSVVSFRCGHRAPAVLLRAWPDVSSSSRARSSDSIFRCAVIRTLSTAPAPQREDQKPPTESNGNEENDKGSTAEPGVGVDRKAAGLKEALTVGGELMYECQAKLFFRLLATASLTQVAFWSSYQMLPTEMMTSPQWGYVGVIASASFGLIARHFAHHYVSEVSLVKPTVFRVCTHTFWGNKGNAKLVQTGSVVVSESKRYYAFKVPGDTFYHLIDIRDGVYHPDGDEGRERVRRLLHGLRIDKKGMQMDALALEEEEKTRVAHRDRRLRQTRHPKHAQKQ